MIRKGGSNWVNRKDFFDRKSELEAPEERLREGMCDLIKSSPASDLLLPLSTALERELGLEPRVAREVEEIAEDIRRELLARPNDSGQRQ